MKKKELNFRQISEGNGNIRYERVKKRGYQQIITGSFSVKGDSNPHDYKTCPKCKRLQEQMDALVFGLKKKHRGGRA